MGSPVGRASLDLAILGLNFLAPHLIGRVRRRAQSTPLDVRGGLLITLAVAFAVFGISEGPVLGWVQPLVIGAVVTRPGSVGNR
jgi:hypothetical protein